MDMAALHASGVLKLDLGGAIAGFRAPSRAERTTYRLNLLEASLRSTTLC